MTVKPAKAKAKPASASQARNRPAITLTIDPHVLERLDSAARAQGLSRSSAITNAVNLWLASLATNPAAGGRSGN